MINELGAAFVFDHEVNEGAEIGCRGVDIHGDAPPVSASVVRKARLFGALHLIAGILNSTEIGDKKRPGEAQPRFSKPDVVFILFFKLCKEVLSNFLHIVTDITLFRRLSGFPPQMPVYVSLPSITDLSQSDVAAAINVL
jgi:hypothetical protein